MKNNLENSIKNQLEQREIPVSENAWDKLSGMMENDERTLSRAETEKKQLKNWWMYAAAASVVIMISLFTINPFEKIEDKAIRVVDSETKLPEETAKTIEAKVEESKAELARSETRSGSNKIENEVAKSELISNKKEEVVIQKKMKVVPNTIEKPEMTLSPEIKLNLPEIQASQQVAANEVQEPKPEPEKKKSKYVDADMLLYSVENNQTISESRDNTKLVIIDFNQ